MTIAQQKRTLGFNASLSLRGVSVSVEGSNPGIALRVIVEPIPAPAESYHISKETRQYSNLHILRTSLQQSEACIEIGSTLQDCTGKKRHRVEVIIDNPADIKVTWRCDTTDIP